MPAPHDAAGVPMKMAWPPLVEPSDNAPELDAQVSCMQACLICAQICTACADTSLRQRNLNELVAVVRLTHDCADQCEATGRTVSRLTLSHPQVLRASLLACAAICGLCAEECELQGRYGMEHCRQCARACRQCEHACQGFLTQLSR